MTDSERAVLNIFRNYQMRPNEMLCLDNKIASRYRSAVKGMIDRGLLQEERRKDAYCLTTEGFQALKAL